MAKQEAFITPSVIKWARKKAHYSIDVAAKKVGVKTEKLEEWENGKGLPTVTQARKMSQVYRRPLAAFYLSEPPKDFPLLKDFRTVEGKTPKYSTPLVFLMRQMQERQIWLSQYLKERGYEKLQFVGSGSMRSPSKIVSRNIIKTIWTNESQYFEVLSNSRSTSGFLNSWLSQCERKGIFISRTSNINSHNLIPVKEARGFVISDEYAPFIFINSKDSASAQLFTLLHELVHLWLDISGVPEHFSISYTDKEFNSNSKKEFFCNQIAAEILMPEETIRNLPKIKDFTTDSVRQFIKEHFKQFKVSRLAFLVRLKTLSLLRNNKIFNSLKNEYIEEHNRYKEEQKKKMKKSDGGLNPNILKIYANGESFTKIVISSYKGGFISGRDASNLLDLKLNRMEKIIKILGE
ncbi:MAG: XRE family transcriptional regulator [Bdellovibrionales bacterium]|nr:XRE family transcriptional regulator [Bdellovibrionales bacterium]